MQKINKSIRHCAMASCRRPENDMQPTAERNHVDVWPQFATWTNPKLGKFPKSFFIPAWDCVLVACTEHRGACAPLSVNKLVNQRKIYIDMYRRVSCKTFSTHVHVPLIGLGFRMFVCLCFGAVAAWVPNDACIGRDWIRIFIFH